MKKSLRILKLTLLLSGLALSGFACDVTKSLTDTEAEKARQEQENANMNFLEKDSDSVDDLFEGDTNLLLDTSFSHVKPGVYSEVYLTVRNLAPGEPITFELSGPAVDSVSKQTLTADNNGEVSFVWKITDFGVYTAASVENDIAQSVTVK